MLKYSSSMAQLSRFFTSVSMDYKKIKPNIILASFPRSGNTFLRNVLYEVYGIYSWNSIDVYNKNTIRLADLTEQKKTNEKLNEQKENRLQELTLKLKFQVVKSHELPSKTLSRCAKNPLIIYLVRDGRDALVSMAHHRKDIVKPGTDFLENLNEAINAPLGTYFGGWSRNVAEWTKIADIVIKFEDFIVDPLKYTESLRSFISLPAPDINKIPTFESQKTGNAHFGGKQRQKFSEEERIIFSKKFFRKGKVGGWKEEMPENVHQFFWKKHGHIMQKMGYSA